MKLKHRRETQAGNAGGKRIECTETGHFKRKLKMHALFRACREQVEQEQQTRGWFNEGCAEVVVSYRAKDLFNDLLNKELKSAGTDLGTEQDYRDVFHAAFVKSKHAVVKAMNEGYAQAEQDYAERELHAHEEMISLFSKNIHLIWDTKEDEYLQGVLINRASETTEQVKQQSK